MQIHGPETQCRAAPGPPVGVLWVRASWAIVLLAGMSGCAQVQPPGPDPKPAPIPDWVRAETGPPMRAQVGVSPEDRTGHPFGPLPPGIHWRLWRYEVPGIKQLSLPQDQPLDIALIALDARVTALKSDALCRPDDCEPIKPKFPAIAILIAPPGSFEQAGVKLGSRVEYGQPSKLAPARTYPLPGP